MVVCYVYVKLLSLLEVKEAKMNIFCCVCVCVCVRECSVGCCFFLGFEGGGGGRGIGG